MEFKEMESIALEERKSAIAQEMDAEGADLDALLEEVRAINEELEARKAEEAKKVELRQMVAAENIGETLDEVEDVEEQREETEKMEIRNTKEYIDAFANYLRTGRDNECRALMTENTENGTVPVPEFVEGKIRTAWERSELMNLVRKTYLKGNLKVGFEISATGAVVHKEGAEAPAEEELVLGIANLTAESIKKWVSVTDEVEDSSEAFIDYIYSELAYRIAQEAAAELLLKIVASPATSSATNPAVPVVSGSGIDTSSIIMAEGMLSAEAQNPVLVISRSKAAELKANALGQTFYYDPFDGLRVVYFDGLGSGDFANVEAILGDFGYGAQANFPNGTDIRIKKNDLSRAKEDIVEFIGRMFVGLGVVAPNAFVVLKTE